MSKNQKAVDLDEFAFRLKCEVNMVNAIHAAMINGDANAEEYCDALFGTFLHLTDMVKELEMSA